jgi:hypothetical protein
MSADMGKRPGWRYARIWGTCGLLIVFNNEPSRRLRAGHTKQGAGPGTRARGITQNFRTCPEQYPGVARSVTNSSAVDEN